MKLTFYIRRNFRIAEIWICKSAYRVSRHINTPTLAVGYLQRRRVEQKPFYYLKRRVPRLPSNQYPTALVRANGHFQKRLFTWVLRIGKNPIKIMLSEYVQGTVVTGMALKPSNRTAGIVLSFICQAANANKQTFRSYRLQVSMQIAYPTSI